MEYYTCWDILGNIHGQKTKGPSFQAHYAKGRPPVLRFGEPTPHKLYIKEFLADGRQKSKEIKDRYIREAGG
jgi:hypothetical protein